MARYLLVYKDKQCIVYVRLLLSKIFYKKASFSRVLRHLDFRGNGFGHFLQRPPSALMENNTCKVLCSMEFLSDRKALYLERQHLSRRKCLEVHPLIRIHHQTTKFRPRLTGHRNSGQFLTKHPYKTKPISATIFSCLSYIYVVAWQKLALPSSNDNINDYLGFHKPVQESWSYANID